MFSSSKGISLKELFKVSVKAMRAKQSAKVTNMPAVSTVVSEVQEVSLNAI